jgi:hypothetical protein
MISRRRSGVSLTPPETAAERKARRSKAAASRAQRAAEREKRTKAAAASRARRSKQAGVMPMARSANTSEMRQAQRILDESMTGISRPAFTRGSRTAKTSEIRRAQRFLDENATDMSLRPAATAAAPAPAALRESAIDRALQATSSTPRKAPSMVGGLRASAIDRQLLGSTTPRKVPSRLSPPDLGPSTPSLPSRALSEEDERPIAAPQPPRRESSSSGSSASAKWAKDMLQRTRKELKQTKAALGLLRRVIGRVLIDRDDLEAERQRLVEQAKSIRVPAARISARSSPERIQQVADQAEEVHAEVGGLSSSEQVLSARVAEAGDEAVRAQVMELNRPKRVLRKVVPSGSPPPKKGKRCPIGLRRGPGGRCYTKTDRALLARLKRRVAACRGMRELRKEVVQKLRFKRGMPRTVRASIGESIVRKPAARKPRRKARKA